MSTITGTFGSGTDWSAMNAAARGDGVQRKALDRADSGTKGVDIAEQKSARAQVRESTGLDTHGSATLSKRADTDSNRSLSAAELDAATKSLVPPPKDTLQFLQRRLGSESESQPRGTVFGRIDGSADGGLRKSEFVAAGPTHRPGIESTTPENLATTGGTADAAYEQLAKVFEAADGDGDGALSHGEFAALKTRLRDSAADALGVNADTESLTASAAVAAYRQDRFDLVSVAQSLAEG